MRTRLQNSGEAILRWLAGRWSIAREIAGEGAAFSGRAVFEPAGGGALSYQETGTLTLANGRSLQAHRRFVYRAVEDAIAILFDDGPDKGELFVRLTFAETESGAVEAAAVHHCGEDVYRVCYALGPDDAFETDIDVAGPRKTYRAVSAYTRIR